MHWCSKCMEAKLLSEFFPKPKLCRPCSSDKQKRYRKTENWIKYSSKQEVKDKANAASKRYYQRNSETIKEKKRDYTDKNKEKMKNYWRSWASNRRKIDLKFKVKENLRKRLRRAVLNKTESAIKLVGCSVDELLLYLESKFVDGMSWENYGNGPEKVANAKYWHIDHIKPCSSFDLSDPEEQKKCFHFTNLQPLWGIDNITKGSSSSFQSPPRFGTQP